MPQGTYTFSGITDPKKGIYSQSHGTEPDRIELWFTWQTANISTGGTVTLSYDGNDIVLPNCKVDQGVFSFNDEGFIERAILFDRRWRWRQYEKISLHFNESMPDGKSHRAITEKTPRAMLSALFDLIGEGTADVSLVPNSSRPELAVDCADVVDVIDDLCERLGCRVILGYDTDVVVVVPIGNGSALPNDSTVSRISVGWDPPEVPKDVQVRFGDTIYQTRFDTEPVGRDTAANNNEILPVDALSYAPTETWANYGGMPLFEDLATDEEIQLARETVWRWFRIVDGPYNAATKIPGYIHPKTSTESVANRFQVLPISSHRAERYTSGEETQLLPARIWGYVYVDADDNDGFAGVAPGLSTDRESELPIEFRVNPANGTIVFPKIVREVSGGATVDPDLVIEVAHTVRNETTWEKDSYQVTSEISSGGTGIVTICASEQRVVIGTYDIDHNLTGFTDNTVELDAVAAQIISDYTASLVAYESYVIHYNILKTTIKPTGKIHQVTHVVSDTGHGAITVAGQFMEWDVGAKTYIEKRRANITKDAHQTLRLLKTKILKESVRDTPVVR